MYLSAGTPLFRIPYLCEARMRLITHNMLQCNVRGVTNGYPLKIEAVDLEIVPVEYKSG
jgi:hypothetical protein